MDSIYSVFSALDREIEKLIPNRATILIDDLLEDLHRLKEEREILMGKLDDIENEIDDIERHIEVLES